MKKKRSTKNLELKTLLLLLPLLSTAVLASIGPGPGFPEAVITPNDMFYTDLASNFDLSKSFYPITAKAEAGNALNLTQPFLKKHFGFHDFQKMNYIKHINDYLVAIVFDNTKIVIQEININGKSFGDHTVYDLSKIGPKVFCSDVTYNPLRDYVYVGCYPAQSTGADKSLRIHTIDLKIKAEANVLLVPQDDGFIIRNRLMLFIQAATQESNDQDNFLILYDQGTSHSQQTRLNNKIRVLRNVDFGNLKFFKLLELDSQDFTAVYDFLSYKETIVVTCRIQKYNQIITMVGCKLDTTKESLQCGTYIKPTGIVDGFVGIFGDNEYFQIDTITNEINIAKLKGEFKDQDWNTEVARTFLGADLFEAREDIWVRYFSGNEEVGVLNWGSNSEMKDFGVTFIAWGEDETWKVEGVSACGIRDVYLWGDTKEIPGTLDIALSWARGPYYFVEGQKLLQGENAVEIEVSDPSGSAKNTFNVRVMTNIYERINIDASDAAQIDSSSKKILKIDKEKILDGNGLHLTATSSNPEILTATGSTNKELEITWDPKFEQNDIIEIFFFENYAVVQNFNNLVTVYNCEQTGMSSLSCKTHAKFQYSSQERISTRSKAIGRNIVIWSTDNDSTYTRFVTDNGNVFTNQNSGVALDYEYIGNNDSSGYIALLFKDHIDVYIVIYSHLDKIQKFGTIDKTNAQNEDFCPRQIQLCPLSKEVLNVISICKEKQVLYRFPTHTLQLKIAFPLIQDLTYNAGLCSMKRELLFFSHVGDMDVLPVYTMHKHPDLFYSDIPVKQFGATTGVTADCIVEGDKAVVMGDEENRKKKWFAVIDSGKELQQNRRYPVIVRNVEASYLRSYKGMGTDLYHVLRKSDGGFQFWVSFDEPRVELESQYVSQDTEVEVELEFANLSNKIFVKQTVVVKAAGKKKRMFSEL